MTPPWLLAGTSVLSKRGHLSASIAFQFGTKTSSTLPLLFRYQKREQKYVELSDQNFVASVACHISISYHISTLIFYPSHDYLTVKKPGPVSPSKHESTKFAIGPRMHPILCIYFVWLALRLVCSLCCGFDMYLIRSCH
jgi:hypothetical protein